ncbi:hypothetical protein [Consotaella salsifontis]|uniref:hypothetical protein n=1 Tax=Consotaella salsifontis TaxID=1365950 RepID=UPI0013F5C3C3|nr:hypothetical protein [Consotaella salsifontis]
MTPAVQTAVHAASHGEAGAGIQAAARRSSLQNWNAVFEFPVWRRTIEGHKYSSSKAAKFAAFSDVIKGIKK